jgi:hypothetical protein
MERETRRTPQLTVRGRAGAFSVDRNQHQPVSRQLVLNVTFTDSVRWYGGLWSVLALAVRL